MDVRSKKIRATLFFMIVVALLVLSASLLVHKAIQDQLAGGRSGFGPFAFLNHRIKGVSAAVLVSSQTAAYLSSVSRLAEEEQLSVFENYKEQARFWDRFLQQKNYQSTMIDDDDLITSLHNYNLLIMPFTLCLSDRQVAAVKLFLEQGKGVIFTHTSGNRDEKGIERDKWSLTSDVLGGFPFYPIRQGQAENITYTLLANTPLTINTPPGWHTRVHTYDQPMAINMVETRANEAAFWSIMQRDGEDKVSYITDKTAIAYGNYTRGRFIWMGFNPSVIVDEPEVWDHFDKFLADSISWATYRTVAGRAFWHNKQAAATFVVVPQRDYIRALTVSDIFTRNKIRPAYLIDPNQAEFYRLMIDQIVRNNEIAAQVTDVFIDSDLARIDLDRKARTVKSDLEKATNTKVYGFESETSVDLNYDFIGRTGYRYVWVRNEQSTIPQTKITNFNSMFRKRRDTVVFYQSAKSDYRIMEELKITEPLDVLNILKNDFHSIYRVGGLYTVTLHSHLIGSEKYHGVLESFLEYVNNRNVHIASPADIAKWWSQQDNVSIRVQDSQRRIVLMITNESKDPIENTTIYLYPAMLPESLSIRAERINVPIPEYTFSKQYTRIDLQIRKLNRGESRTYYIDQRP